MVAKNLIVFLLLSFLTHSIRVQVGNYDDKTKTWTGYNPACDEQCHAHNSTICGDGVRLCCEKDACANVKGFQICKKKVTSFTCDQSLKSELLTKLLGEL